MNLTLKYSGITVDLTGDEVREFPSILVAAMLEEAIASLAEAIASIERGDVEARCEATVQAIDCITELRGALDHGQGGSVSEQLDRLYKFIMAQIPMINVLNDAAFAQEMIALIAPIRDAWVELDQRIRANVAEAEARAAASPSAPAPGRLKVVS